MSIIDPDGLFGGDRLRRCSNLAQLHWPRLFLASDGFGRLEINYARIVGRAYPTFNPIPTAEEIGGYIQEYAERYLLFVYEGNGQQWGQWDTKPEFLPRYKTALDRRSPIPDVRAFQNWKRQYLIDCNSFPKCFGNFSPRVETFPSGVGVGVGVGVEKTHTEPRAKTARSNGFSPEYSEWFEGKFWPIYWRKDAKAAGKEELAKHAKTPEDRNKILSAAAMQRSGFEAKENQYRPHLRTWAHQKRFDDEPELFNGNRDGYIDAKDLVK